jgi:hypothetical protein
VDGDFADGDDGGGATAGEGFGAEVHSAAPVRASRRRGMGVVPAWSAWPVRLMARRVWPAMVETVAAGWLSCSRTRPCSMWSST